MRPQHNLLFGYPLVIFLQKLPVFTLLGDCSVGFHALFLILAALIQWVLSLAGRRAPGTLPLRDIVGNGCQAEQG